MKIVDDLSKEISDLKKNKREKIGMNDLKPQLDKKKYEKFSDKMKGNFDDE